MKYWLCLCRSGSFFCVSSFRGRFWVLDCIVLTCSEIGVLVKRATLAMKATLLHQHLKSIVFLFFFSAFFKWGRFSTRGRYFCCFRRVTLGLSRTYSNDWVLRGLDKRSFCRDLRPITEECVLQKLRAYFLLVSAKLVSFMDQYLYIYILCLYKIFVDACVFISGTTAGWLPYSGGSSFWLPLVAPGNPHPESAISSSHCRRRTVSKNASFFHQPCFILSAVAGFHHTIAVFMFCSSERAAAGVVAPNSNIFTRGCTEFIPRVGVVFEASPTLDKPGMRFVTSAWCLKQKSGELTWWETSINQFRRISGPRYPVTTSH